MTFAARTKDDPGDVGRAADQQQSIDNEAALYAALLGEGPVATGGMVKQFVKKTAIADNVATEVFTITTTNEAGSNDGGVYWCLFEGVAVHVGGVAGDNAVSSAVSSFSRAMKSTGVGMNSGAAAFGVSPQIAESEGGATKGIATCVMSVVETSEYVQSVKFTVDLDGSAVTTATVLGMVTVFYHGFTTPPVITSAG